MIDEPKFGEITDPEEVLKLVEQNKEVFINGKTLYQTFTDMVKSVNDQQTPAEETFTKDSPQSATPSSSGYSSPDSRRSSFSGASEFSGEEDETLENSMSDDEKKYEQEGSENGVDEIIDGIEELKEEKETFAQHFAKQAKQLEDLKLECDSLKNEINKQQQAIFERDQKIEEQDASIKSLTEKLKKSEELNQNIEKEGDTGIRTLSEGKQILEGEVKKLKAELKRITQEKDQGIEQLTQEIKALEKKLQGTNNVIGKLSDQLKNKENEINRINEEQQEKLEQSEAKLSVLEKKNANLENDLKKTLLEGLKNNHEKQLAEELTEARNENNTLAKEMKQLSQEFNALQRKNEDLERKIQQPEPGRSLADEMSEVNTNEEIDKLKQQLKAKDDMLTHTQEELKSVKEALEKLQDILQQKKDLAAISTQTEVEYKSVEIQASDQETTVPKTQDQGTNAGVDASSSIDHKETKEMEIQTDVQMNDFRDLYDKEGKYVRTELSDPNTVPAKTTEKSTPSKG